MKSAKVVKRISIFMVLVMMFSSLSVIAFASENNNLSFGDVLYSENGITVFYGNPNENLEGAQLVEKQNTRGMQYDQSWVAANSSADRTISIPASSSNSITYYTVRQETDGNVSSSYVYVFRPDGTACLTWNMGSSYNEISNRVVGTSSSPNSTYTWTNGIFSLRWKVTTGSNPARINLWVW